MRVFAAVLFVLSAAVPALAGEVLPSRNLVFPPVLLIGVPLVDFDAIDFQAKQQDQQRPVRDAEPHSRFEVKRHIGGAAGFDSGNVHESIGLYLTVAEWGRWNFGVPAVELGFGRYRVYDPQRGESTTKDRLTLIVSMASVHYRMGYLKPFGVHWYINLERVYDLRDSMSGSQFGLSFSRK